MTDPYGQHQPAQYSQAPQGHPGYQGYAPPGPPPGAAPPNYLAWSIISIFTFWPLAIAAIIKSNSVDSLWADGKYELARQASKTTKMLCLIALIIFIAMIILITVFLIIAAATISQLPNVPDFEIR